MPRDHQLQERVLSCSTAAAACASPDTPFALPLVQAGSDADNAEGVNPAFYAAIAAVAGLFVFAGLKMLGGDGGEVVSMDGLPSLTDLAARLE